MFLKSVKIDTDIWDINLDYADKNNVTSLFISEGNIHPYPAKAVANMVHDLLYKLKDAYKVESVLDPFVGSGTVALESKLLGLDFYGSDLNPLAVLLAKTKSLTIKGTPYIRKKLEEFTLTINVDNMKSTLYELVSFNNIDYWFKQENIEQLSYIKWRIELFLKSLPTRYKTALSLITLTAFSTTIRESSLSRNDEFKLYRLSPGDREKFTINSIEVFSKRIVELLNMIQDVNIEFRGDTKSEIFLKNAKDLSYLRKNKVDLIFTSPPYGDSQSTVAYGQFSRLSLQWMFDLMKNYLGIETVYQNCDEYLLGGKYSVVNNLKNIDALLNTSSTFKKLVDDMNQLVKTELQEIDLDILKLGEIRQKIEENNFDFTVLADESIISILIKERIRLYNYKKNNENINLEKKEVKKITIKETEKFLSDLYTRNGKNCDEKIEILKNTILPNVLEALKRKRKFLPKRVKEVIDFFIDLFKVTEQTDMVIKNDGIQVWIVGHRTVLGSIEVNMANILNEWFKSRNYSQLALITRTCHFKRLPMHINSTVTRDKQIKTMAEEYVLIVKKD